MCTSGNTSTAAKTTSTTPQEAPPFAPVSMPAPVVHQNIEQGMKRKRLELQQEEEVTVLPGLSGLDCAWHSTGDLHVSGSVTAKAFIQFSDLRLKTNISDIVDAMRIVTSLQGKTYFWKQGTAEQEHRGKRVIGMIAQEVQKILPEVGTFQTH